MSLIPLGGDLGDATLTSWEMLFADPAFADGLVFTLRIALISTAISAVLGVMLALGLRRRTGGLRALAALPVPVPHLLVAVVAVVWLSPGGVADRVLGSVPFDVVRDGGGAGIVIVYVYKEAPFIALLVLASMGRALAEREEAAAVMGVGRLKSAAWILWPAIRAPLLLGCVIVMAFAVGSFEVPLAIGPNYPPTLSVYAFESIQGDVVTGEGRAAASLLLTGVMATLLAVVALGFARRVDRG